jgi:hypothetical protein
MKEKKIAILIILLLEFVQAFLLSKINVKWFFHLIICPVMINQKALKILN